VVEQQPLLGLLGVDERGGEEHLLDDMAGPPSDEMQQPRGLSHPDVVV
jgi:hypothetical protein